MNDRCSKTSFCREQGAGHTGRTRPFNLGLENYHWYYNILYSFKGALLFYCVCVCGGVILHLLFIIFHENSRLLHYIIYVHFFSGHSKKSEEQCSGLFFGESEYDIFSGKFQEHFYLVYQSLFGLSNRGLSHLTLI